MCAIHLILFDLTTLMMFGDAPDYVIFYSFLVLPPTYAHILSSAAPYPHTPSAYVLP
jgi:hypothetical protein